MLVIRRRAGESFVIDGNIHVEVLEVGSNQVKLGITAPKDVPILRKEVQITGEQNQAAARGISSTELAALAGKWHR
jgi:carbon storage regulator